MARLMATSAWTAVLALSVNSGCSGDSQQAQGGAGGGGGAGGAGQSSSAANGSSSVASSSATTGPGSGAGGGGGEAPMPFVCDPPAEPGSIYEQSAESLNIEEVDPVSMCKYRGNVMLLINTAAV